MMMVKNSQMLYRAKHRAKKSHKKGCNNNELKLHNTIQYIAYTRRDRRWPSGNSNPFFFVKTKKIRHMTRAESWQQFMAVNHGYCLPKLSQDRGFIFQR